MKVRVTLTNDKRYVGELVPGGDAGWVSLTNLRGKFMSFPAHAILMLEEL